MRPGWTEKNPPVERPWRNHIVRIIAFCLGLFFIMAALLKAMDMALFTRQILAYGIIGDRTLATLSAWGLITLECGLGVGLILFYRLRLFLSFIILLLLLFIGANFWAWITGSTSDCGCFGSLINRSPAATILEDLILMICAIAAFMGVGRHPENQRRWKLWIIVVACIFGLTIPFLFGFKLTTDNNSRFSTVEKELLAATVAGVEKLDFKSGSFFIMLMDIGCPECEKGVMALNEMAEEIDLPQLISLCANTEEMRINYINQFQPLFPIGRIEEAVFWRLLGDAEIPRFFLLKNQRLMGLWEKEAPNAQTVRDALLD